MNRIHKVVSIITLLIFAYHYNVFANDYPKYFINEPQIEFAFQKCHSSNLQPVNIEEYVEEYHFGCPDYNIPLAKEFQHYAWDLAAEGEISYELVLAIMKKESRFKINAKNVNKKSVDRGLMQINSAHQEYNSKRAGVNNFNPYNPYHSIKVGISILVNDRKYWRSLGMSEEEVYLYTIGSYNKGITGVLNGGLPWKYINEVSQYKAEFEMGHYSE